MILRLLFYAVLEKPALALLLGIPVSAVCLGFAAQSFVEYRQYASGPRPYTLEDAVEAARAGDVYVRLPADSPDCSRAIVVTKGSDAKLGSESRTYVPLRDGSGHYAAFAVIDGNSCDLPAGGLEGVLAASMPGQAALVDGYLNREALGFALCTNCGPGESALKMLLATCFALTGLLLYPGALRLKRGREKPNP